MLLVAGLWTPIVASAVAVLVLISTHCKVENYLTGVLLGTLAIALVLLGPGAWSIDSRLFGWKRIDLSDIRD